jgi:hypothetical protein
MAKYLINICYGDLANRKNSSHPSDDQFIMGKYMEWSKKMADRIIVTHKLKDGEGRRLEMKEAQVKDGPYTETKESVGGFYLIEAKNYQEACELAKECPTLLYQGGYVEVREVEF